MNNSPALNLLICDSESKPSLQLQGRTIYPLSHLSCTSAHRVAFTQSCIHTALTLFWSLKSLSRREILSMHLFLSPSVAISSPLRAWDSSLLARYRLSAASRSDVTLRYWSRTSCSSRSWNIEMKSPLYSRCYVEATGAGIHLRGLGPGQHSSEEWQLWRHCVQFDQPRNWAQDLSHRQRCVTSAPPAGNFPYLCRCCSFQISDAWHIVINLSFQIIARSYDVIQLNIKILLISRQSSDVILQPNQKYIKFYVINFLEIEFCRTKYVGLNLDQRFMLRLQVRLILISVNVFFVKILN